MMSTFLASVLLAASAANPLSAWRLVKQITPPADPRPGFVELAFDSEVFAGANASLSDLRIMNSAGLEVPYVLATESSKYTREPRPAKLYNKGTNPGVSSTFSVDLGEQPGYHNQLTIITDSRNFRREVSIEGSNDEVSWLTMSGTRFIYDYTLEFTARDTTIRYPDSNYRYLRVTMRDNGAPPVNILQIELVREVSIPARSVTYEPSIIINQHLSDLKVSQVIFDLGTRGQPTSGLTLVTADSNFNRAVSLEGSDDNSRWSQVLSRDVIFSYQTPQFRGSKLTLSYPESGYRYLRLTVFNRDDQPVNITGATAMGVLRKLVFSYVPTDTYKLFYGNQVASRPEYDLQNYLEYYGTAGRQQVTLGAESANSLYQAPPAPVIPFSERYQGLLFAALVVAVGVVGWLIIRLLRRNG